MFSQTEKDALASLVERAFADRKKAAQELGTTTNTKFLEDLLSKLGTRVRQNHRRPDER
jgi:hypothetical protein